MRENLPGPCGLARRFAPAQPLGLTVASNPRDGASAALHGLSVVPTTARAARLASGHASECTRVGLPARFFRRPSPCQRGSRGISRQAPKPTPTRAAGDIAVVALPGTHLSSVGTVIDGFALVAQQIQVLFAPPYQIAMESKVRLLATSGDSVALAGQRALAADGDLLTRGRYQAVYVTAFEASDEATLLGKLAHETGLGAWLRTQHAAHVVIGAAGTAVFVLAEAGLLDKGIAAVPREWSNLFRRRYPRIRLETRAAVAEHEKVLTTGAPATEWQLVVRLVEYVTSLNSARWLATRSGLARTRGSTAEISEDPLVAAAQHWLGERFAQPFKITDMARELAVSHSTLLRRFERSLSTTPRRYAQMLRMESAKLMLARTHRSIDTISTMLGYADTRSFRTAFRGHTSMSPMEYRTTMGR